MNGFVDMLQEEEENSYIFDQYKLRQIIEYVNDFIKRT
jgi:hypothetical protein